MTPSAKSVHSATASDAIRDYTRTGKPTRSYSLLHQAAGLDDRVNDLKSQTREMLEQSQHENVEKRAASKARRSVPELLSELTAARGMSWVDVAALVGVSVSAVRKWRKGSDATADSRLRLARLAATLDLLEELTVADPAQWMEIPLHLPAGYTVRPVDLYLAGALPGILSIAANRREPEEVMDEAVPGWRTALYSEFEVVTAPDGNSALQKRSP